MKTGNSEPGFSASNITDSKRLVRGEHILNARNLLRKEHGHFGPRRILMLAGGEPSEEIGALRKMFSSGCHITCVDKDDLCLERAIEAGADDILNVDIHDWNKTDAFEEGDRTRYAIRYPEGIEGKEFELIDLDFCGGLTEQVRDTVKAYSYLLSERGIIMVTFSYGRDVVERFISEARGGNFLGETLKELKPLIESGVSESLVGRILFLCSIRKITALSALCYQGKQMPMCALLFQANSKRRRMAAAGSLYLDCGPIIPPITMVDPCDLDYMFASDALPALYASPRERIEQARRKFTAAKAAASRSGRIRAEGVIGHFLGGSRMTKDSTANSHEH